MAKRDEVAEIALKTEKAIASFSGETRDFRSDFERHLEIIRRYDEVICEKASKVCLY
jgi:hypothetical protein